MKAGRGRSAVFIAAMASILGCAVLSVPLHSQDKAATDLPATRQAYALNCAGCHGEKLTGTSFGPELRGAAFLKKWSVQPEGALLKYIRETMPPGNMGGLPEETYAGLAALIAAESHLAAGQAGGRKSEYAAPAEALTGNASAAVESQPDAALQKELARRAAIATRAETVTDQMLRQPDPRDWLNWRRTDDGSGSSPLAGINRGNVASLQVGWTLALRPSKNGITPLVHDGILFVSSDGDVRALDVTTGEMIWRFTRKDTLAGAEPIGQPKNMAIYGNMLFVPTIDAHMLALDFRTGSLIWDRKLVEASRDVRITGGPIVANGKVIQGLAGCQARHQPGGCMIVGLDARSGEELWRLNTLQRPQKQGKDTWNGIPLEERFGGSIWSTGTYDPELRTVFFGTAQTYWIGSVLREPARSANARDMLFTDSTLALDPDTGRLKWFYQHLRRDIWDMDWAFERIIVPVERNGKVIKAVATMGKLGIMDFLDARTGKYLKSHDLGIQNIVTAIDPATGAKSTDPDFDPATTPTKPMCPYATGVRNFPAISYDPATNRFFVPAIASCTRFFWKPGETVDIGFKRPTHHPDYGDDWGAVFALDARDGSRVWRKTGRAPASSAMLATAGGLVFGGARDRWFRAYDARDGSVLWQIRLNDVPNSFPITFEHEGTQYVAVVAGGGAPADSSWAGVTPELPGPSGSTTLWVFRLPARSN